MRNPNGWNNGWLRMIVIVKLGLFSYIWLEKCKSNYLAFTAWCEWNLWLMIIVLIASNPDPGWFIIWTELRIQCSAAVIIINIWTRNEVWQVVQIAFCNEHSQLEGNKLVDIKQSRWSIWESACIRSYTLDELKCNLNFRGGLVPI